MTLNTARARRVAVLDIGKTNVKAVRLSDGTEDFARTIPNGVLRDGPYPHFDIPRLQDFFVDALADMYRRGGFDAVSVTAHGASGALMRGNELALPVLDYEHPGPDETSDAYDGIRPPFAETFSPRLPGGLNLGAQLFWQSHRFPESFAAASHFVTYPQFWSGWLTGVPATEATSLGTHTDLWCPRGSRFSSMVDALGWRSKMAPLRAASDVLGPIAPALAHRIGVTEPVAVACGIHDSNASLLPHLQSETGRFSVVSTGTWVVVFAVGGDLDRLDPGRDMLANVDAWSRPVPAMRFMGGREYEQLTGTHRGVTDPAAVGTVLENKIMALPGFAPGTGPFPDAIGRWSHDPDALTPAQRIAVASLYGALMTATCLELLGASGPTVVEGPLSRNDLFCDMLQAITGRPAHAALDGTGTSAGAAALVRPSEHSPRYRAGPRGPVDDRRLAAYAASWREACSAARRP